jgi:hypothetical protein
MKSLTTFIGLFISLQSFPQADLDLTLTFITDEPQYNTRVINFGLDSTATNGLDPHLGEFAYPPDGCAGPGGVVFCTAFYLPPPSFNEYITPKDYRHGLFPYSGQVEHRLVIILGVSATEALMVWDFPPGVIVVITDYITGTFFSLELQDSGSYVFTDSLLSLFSLFAMTVNYENILPVELISFNAVVNEKDVELSWTTTTETNNSGFEILRKDYPANVGTQNDSEWNTIGFVPGFGTTTEPKSYSFTDEDVSTGIYIYHLKQIDFDGSFEYSNELEVEADFTPKEFVLYQNYPNPFNPTTTIKYKIPGQARNDNVLVMLKVYDVLGNEVATLVNREKQPGTYEVEFNSHSGKVRNLTSGIYFYTLRVGDFVQTRKMAFAK